MAAGHRAAEDAAAGGEGRPDFVAAVLEIVGRSGRPTGSRVVREHLLRLGFEVSESTVGRLLGETDRRGYTEPKGRLGRVLTSAGHAQVQALHDHTSRDRNAR